MAIRLRNVNGRRVALCAAVSEPQEKDLYLDDADHYALSLKFAKDWKGQLVDWDDEDINVLMAEQENPVPDRQPEGRDYGHI